MLVDKTERQNEWAETFVEVFFLENTVFANDNTQNDDYMLELLNNIQKQITKDQLAIESAANLAGQLDTICEQKEVFKAKINASLQDPTGDGLTVQDTVWL